MAEKLYFPAVDIRENGSHRCQALAGLKAVSILDEKLRRKPGDHLQHEEKEQVYRAHAEMLRAMASWPDSVLMSLNIVSWPDRDFPLRGCIEIYILLSVLSDSTESAVAETLARFGAVTALLNNYLPAVEFRPITNSIRLRTKVCPFKPGAAVVIGRRREQLSAAMPAKFENKPIGFLAPMNSRHAGSRKPKISPRLIPYLFPWITAPMDMSSVGEVLLWYQAPLWLSVRMRPARASKAVIRRLSDSLKWCEELLNGQDATHTTLEIQTQALRSAITQRIQDMQLPVFKGGVLLISPVEIDEAIIGAVAQTISHKPMTKDYESSLQGGYSFRHIKPEAIRHSTWYPDNEPFTIHEAACAFRIPHPESEHSAGFPVKNFHTALADSYRDEKGPEALNLGQSCHRGYAQPVNVSTESRMRHMFILGQTGTGKSALLETLIVQDINSGKGLCVIDPHGDLVEAILNQYPPDREHDLIIIDFVDREYPVSMNFLAWNTLEERDLIIDELYSTLDRIYDMKETGGPMFEQYFRGMMRLLMGDHNEKEFVPTMLEFELLFTDSEFRDLCARDVSDLHIKNFLKQIEQADGEARLANMAPYVISKLNRFYLDTTLRRIVGQEEMTLDFRRIMDEGRVILINLGKGRFGEGPSTIMASQIIARFKAAAMSRTQIPPGKRRDFFIYIDEFQNVANAYFLDLLSEARKYRLGLILANQYAQQLEKIKGTGGDSILSAILGNVGTIVTFRLGIRDAKIMEQVFTPIFSKEDLFNIPNYHCYVNINTGLKRPMSFSMISSYKPGLHQPGKVERLRNISRKKYAGDSKSVERQIQERSELIHFLLSEYC